MHLQDERGPVAVRSLVRSVHERSARDGPEPDQASDRGGRSGPLVQKEIAGWTNAVTGALCPAAGATKSPAGIETATTPHAASSAQTRVPGASVSWGVMAPAQSLEDMWA